MFIPEQSFDALIKMQMERFKEPMLNCVDRVSEELIRMIQNCGDKVQQEMKRFPLLFDHIHKIVSTMIITKTEETADFVKQLLDNELAFINTRHPEFIKSAELLKALGEDPDHALQQLRKGSGDAKSKLTNYRGNLTSHEKRDYLIIERLIDQYFHIAQNSIKDRVPKAIMNCLVNYIFEHLHSELMAGLYDQTDVDKLLAETEDLARLRKETEDMLKALNKANTFLSEIRSIKV
uniref:GED domain-containing protein n=1 Tax=Panagrolaimus davidi TaxID=227884 RepID=A0A914PHI8_9BILA